MNKVLYSSDKHICLIYRHLISGQGAVQANQVVIHDHGRTAMLDPGGNLLFPQLLSEMQRLLDGHDLDYVIASHQDPDVVSALEAWLGATKCRIVLPELWERFLPHAVSIPLDPSRLIGIPDEGARLPLGESELIALPAHFLHSEGNFSFYDPVSKILFSGDIGANISVKHLDMPVKQLSSIMPFMLGFHRRYMNSNRVCRYWADMVRELDVCAIVPQHGRCFQGEEVVGEFLDWFASLSCGVDNMEPADYRVPPPGLVCG